MCRSFGGRKRLRHGLNSIPAAGAHDDHQHRPAPARTRPGCRRGPLNEQGSHAPGNTTNTTAKKRKARRETNHSVAGRACLTHPLQPTVRVSENVQSNILHECTRHTAGSAFCYVYIRDGIFSYKTCFSCTVQCLDSFLRSHTRQDRMTDRVDRNRTESGEKAP